MWLANQGEARRTGVLIVGHGTRDPAGTREFFLLAERLKSHLHRIGLPTPVQASLLEFQQPTIPEGWQSLVRQGVNDVVVAPLLLFAAGHARNDIPEIIGACANDSPGVRWRQVRPLSRHRRVVELAVERISSCYAKHVYRGTPANIVSGGGSCDATWAFVPVGRGSHDPCARSDMLLLGEVLARRVNAPSHATAFYAMSEPRLPAVLDRVASEHSPRDLVVYPHLLFQGRLYGAIRRQVEEASERHPDTRFHLTRYLGPEFAIAEALGDRAGLGYNDVNSQPDAVPHRR